ncbi:MAG: hypothetical protein HXY34_05645 [Candidatus Thorarchaeota archaeon]|nr:hypothetical protein [Candidatus Thorarchaeota archaeon]
MSDGDSLEDRRMQDEVERAMRVRAEAEPDNYWAWLMLSIAASDAGDIREAVRAAARAMQMHPECRVAREAYDRLVMGSTKHRS